MNTTTVERTPLATEVLFGANEMTVRLADGRSLSVPLAWFPRLARASRPELEHYELMGDGEGIHWPDLDEDLSVAGLMR
ncbi:MAG: hypothetical protein CTY20_00410 [Hyphomicrobium sp.]|nr:MAG: hypothetical protein CTY20_00410 [Hyphomicrobium sp.]